MGNYKRFISNDLFQRVQDMWKWYHYKKWREKGCYL